MKERNRDIRLFLFTLFLVMLVTFGFWMLSHTLANLSIRVQGEVSPQIHIAKMQRMLKEVKHNLQATRVAKPTKVSSIEDTLDAPTAVSLFKPGTSYKWSKADIQCLARNIYYEAGVESDLGKYAVAQVTYNRAVRKGFPNTICGVVNYKVKNTCAFSWVCMNKEAPKGLLWKRSQEIAKDFAEHGVRLYTVREATFYHATYIKKPYWAKDMKQVAVIDQHIFY